jgi:hypothetical protein
MYHFAPYPTKPILNREDLPFRQRLIFTFMEDHFAKCDRPLTAKQIANHFGLQVPTIVERMDILIAKGFVFGDQFGLLRDRRYVTSDRRYLL